MSKKQEAIGKYFSDLLRSIGLAFFLFSAIGLVFDRAEVTEHKVATIVIGIIGCILMISGAIVIVLYSKELPKNQKRAQRRKKKC